MWMVCGGIFCSVLTQRYNKIARNDTAAIQGLEFGSLDVKNHGLFKPTTKKVFGLKN